MKEHHSESYQIYLKARNLEEVALGLYHAAVRGEDLKWDTVSVTEHLEDLTRERRGGDRRPKRRGERSKR